jgi:MazG family protein
MPTPPPDSLPPIERLRAIVAVLRSPEGCPWDREQTHSSLRAGLIEEAYEVVEAINRNDDANLCEELGDFLLQTVFHSQIAEESGRFAFDDIARAISEKLIRRHPHVFGDDQCADSAEVLRKWDDLKRAEKGPRVESALDGVSGGMPALMHAEKIQKKAARVGFDWQETAPVIEKVREELAEIEFAIAAKHPEAIEEEVGDLLFSVVNLARKLKLDGETALRRSTDKFASRFRLVEKAARERGLVMQEMSLAELDALWDEAKRLKAVGAEETANRRE